VTTRYSFKHYRLKKMWYVLRRGDIMIRIGTVANVLEMLRIDVRQELERHGENDHDHHPQAHAKRHV
jgi:hypothetical protein